MNYFDSPREYSPRLLIHAGTQSKHISVSALHMQAGDFLRMMIFSLSRFLKSVVSAILSRSDLI